MAWQVLGTGWLQAMQVLAYLHWEHRSHERWDLILQLRHRSRESLHLAACAEVALGECAQAEGQTQALAHRGSDSPCTVQAAVCACART